MKWTALLFFFLLACEATASPPPPPAPSPSSSEPVPPPLVEPLVEPVEPASPSAPPSTSSRTSQEIASVLQAHRPKIRRCASDRDQTGSVKLVFTIAPKGTVKTVTPEDNAGFDAEVVKCMVARVKELKFPEASDETRVKFPMIVR